MHGNIATEQTRLDTDTDKSSVVRAIMQTYSNALQGFQRHVLTPIQVFNLDELVEDSCVTYEKKNTPSTRCKCYRVIPFTVVASLAASAVVYRLYCWH